MVTIKYIANPIHIYSCMSITYNSSVVYTWILKYTSLVSLSLNMIFRVSLEATSYVKRKSLLPLLMNNFFPETILHLMFLSPTAVYLLR